ncbi:MAG: hypothetical protein AB7F43_14605 [Bacteriovoracia bacterium]
MAELSALVEKMLAQFEVSYFQVLYPDLSWSELGQFLSEELDEDERINTLAYWLDFADRKRIAFDT